MLGACWRGDIVAVMRGGYPQMTGPTTRGAKSRGVQDTDASVISGPCEGPFFRVFLSKSPGIVAP
jgi:hypothetical protein